MTLLGPFGLAALIPLLLIADGLSLEPDGKGSISNGFSSKHDDKASSTLLNTDHLERYGGVASALDQFSLPETGKDELSEASLSGENEVNGGATWEVSKSLPSWTNKPLSKRRVEIHPKSEGRVTLTQIEKECEESMRKQLKENQHKKKLQFNFIGKRNDTAECYPLVSEVTLVKRDLSESDNSDHRSRANGKNELTNESNLKTSGKRWMTAREMQPDDGSGENFKLPTEKPIQTSNKMMESSAVMSNPDIPKIQEQRNDQAKSLDPGGAPTRDSNDQNQGDQSDKVIMREITDCEDRDLKLLKLLYEGLNSKDGINEVEPLVKTLKDIAEKKMAMNMITHNNITAKPVAMKTDDKTKSSNQMKCANELLTKMKEYRDKQPEKKMYNVGSSPLNPCLINSKKDTVYPFAGKNVFLSQPRRSNPEIFTFPRKSSSLISSSVDQVDSPEAQLFPSLGSNSKDNKSIGDYAVFVQLIDRILGTISDNNTETTEIIHDLNRKLLGTNKEVGSYRMLEDLVREFGNSVAKIKGSYKDSDTAEERIEDLLRNSREVRNFNRFVESKGRNSQAPNAGKTPPSLPPLNSLPKQPSKSWSKSDELRRLQKVATELKSKIDDLLTNLDGTMSEADDDDDDDDDEDDEDDEGEEDSLAGGSTAPVNLSAGGSRGSKASDDPFESFKKFKSNEPKPDNKRKFKEYEPRCRDRLSKIVGKKPITMSSRLRALQDRNRDLKYKTYKTRRDKRDDLMSHYYDKYDIYNFKSSRRKSAEDNRQGSSNDIPENSFVVDPARIGAMPNSEYPVTYKNSENNFNVFRVANEFKKVHRNMIDKRMESSLPRVNGFQKYLGDNQIRRGKVFNIRKQYDKTPSRNRWGHIESGQENVRDDFDNEPIAGNVQSKHKKTDVPHWLDYNDSELKPQNETSNGLLTIPVKKYFNKSNKDKISFLLRNKRSIKNILGYFKGKKTKAEDEVVNTIVSKEIKTNCQEQGGTNNSEQLVAANLSTDGKTRFEESKAENLNNPVKTEQVTQLP